MNFNPRPPCGGRHGSEIRSRGRLRFQSTPPVWGATKAWEASLRRGVFQSTPPVWGATGQLLDVGDELVISIHAPRVGGDHPWRGGCFPRADFNPRPPCGGRLVRQTSGPPGGYFNPRPPCGGRPLEHRPPEIVLRISIHAPRVGGDLHLRPYSYRFRHFNPRPPCGGRQERMLQQAQIAEISIHAPRVGGDFSFSEVSSISFYFNPRPPCGGRQSGRCAAEARTIYFNPRPPCGGRRRILNTLRIFSQHFNPRPPCGGRHSQPSPRTGRKLFQSTPPVWGATFRFPCRCRRWRLFQSTPPVWGATRFTRCRQARSSNFNPRPPCGGRQQKQLKIQAVRAKNRQFLQISSPNSYPILKNKVASLQIILQNLVRDLGDFLRVYVSHLKHQYIFWVVGCLYSKMLDLVFIAVSQVIKTKTVLFRVHDLTQLCL